MILPLKRKFPYRIVFPSSSHTTILEILVLSYQRITLFFDLTWSVQVTFLFEEFLNIFLNRLIKFMGNCQVLWFLLFFLFSLELILNINQFTNFSSRMPILPSPAFNSSTSGSSSSTEGFSSLRIEQESSRWASLTCLGSTTSEFSSLA